MIKSTTLRLAVVCSTLLAVQILSAAQPNIVFLFADDMRPDAIGALGHPVIKTPNLDAMVRNGTTFTRAITAYPICHVSRSEIFSGRSAFRSGYYYRGRDYEKDVKLWPEAMKAAGYRTWYVGKWHSPRDAWKTGFEETRGLYSGGGGGTAARVTQYDTKGRAVTGYRGWTFKTDQNKSEPEKGIGLTPDISARFADAAIELIDRKPDRPFFLQVNFTAPHDPLLQPPGHR
ncbi:MAG: arylsulfatase A-like enzyme, partial [Yoonia sp.]